MFSNKNQKQLTKSNIEALFRQQYGYLCCFEFTTRPCIVLLSHCAKTFNTCQSQYNVNVPMT